MTQWLEGIIGAMMTNYARKDDEMNELVPESDKGVIPFDPAQLAADAELGGKIGLEDIAVPYLYVLQNNSPQCNPDHAKYIKGAQSGMLYLSNLEKVYSGREGGLVIVPCYFERMVTEWIPRSQGGGIVATHGPEAEIIKQAKPQIVEDKEMLVLPNGHQLIDTMYNYFLAKLPDTGGWVQCIAPFKSTGLKVARRMNNIIKTNRYEGNVVPRWFYLWSFTTVKEQKDNYVWSSPKLEQLPNITWGTEVYSQAKEFAIIASKGVLRRIAIEADQEAEAPAKRVIDDTSPI